MNVAEQIYVQPLNETSSSQARLRRISPRHSLTMTAFRLPTDSVSAIFFDLDNTLIKTRKADSLTCRKLAEELTEKYGIPQDVSDKLTGTFLRQFRKCPDNLTSSLDAWRTGLWSKALGEKYAHLASKVYERWLFLRYHYLAPAADVVSTLQRLRKTYLLGLVTNGPSNAQWEKVQRLALEQYLDIILVSGDLPWEKPEAAIFHRACQYLNVSPDTCVMVGDKLETDILGAKKAGLAGAIWIPMNDNPCISPHDPKPDFTIRRIADLVGILNPGPNAPELEDSSSNASDGS